MKALVSFLRYAANVATLAKHWRTAGLEGLACLIERISFPSFAEWRWNTLSACWRQLDKLLQSLIVHFTPALFGNSRDPTKLRLVCEALYSETWLSHFRFVLWYTDKMGRILSWGAGCPCHEEEALRGETVTCWRKGRRLHQVYDFATNYFAEMLEVANSWTVGTFGSGPVFFQQYIGCVRLTALLGEQKLVWADRLPYLLTRLDEAGVKDRCLEQYANGVPGTHHRVTEEFLQPGSRLRHDIDNMGDGTPMSEELAFEVQSLKDIVLDDGIGEGPHALASRIKQHSRSCSWPFVASSMRISQNLRDCREIDHDIDIDLQSLWCNFKSVVRFNGSKRSLKPVRMHDKPFSDRVYRMMHFLKEVGGEDEWRDDANDHDMDDGGDDPPPGGPRNACEQPGESSGNSGGAASSSGSGQGGSSSSGPGTSGGGPGASCSTGASTTGGLAMSLEGT